MENEKNNLNRLQFEIPKKWIENHNKVQYLNKIIQQQLADQNIEASRVRNISQSEIIKQGAEYIQIEVWFE